MGVYKRGNVYWGSKQINGKKLDWSLKTKIRRVAEVRYAKDVTRIEDGSYFTQPVVVPKMKEVIDRYMKEISPLQNSHRRNQEIAAHWCDFLGDLPLTDVSKSVLSSYKAKRLTGELRYGLSKNPEKRRKAGESTVKRELSFLRGVFNKAIDEWELCSFNPVRKVIKGLKEKKRVRYVLPEEAEKLRFTLPAWLKPIVVVGCHTGLREGNIVNLTLSQCDFHNDRININDHEMKNGEPFSIRMTPEVKATLQNVLKERKVIGPYVFADEKGSPYSRNAVSMSFRRACNRAGISDLHFHDLRHDFATLLINSGASLYQVQHALGHKDQRMSARYAHLLPENRDVINMINGKGTTAILLQSAENKKGSLA